MKLRIKQTCETCVRYGYCCVQVLLRRECWDVQAKSSYSLYKEMGLCCAKKVAKRPVKATLRADLSPASMTNQVGARDFVHDELANAEYSYHRGHIVNFLASD